MDCSLTRRRLANTIGGETMALPGIDLLIVDDNPLLVNVLVEILEGCGHSVRSASDGFTALALIRQRLPDVLVSDLNMPRMSGYELLSIVRRRFPSIAVIAMSGAYSAVAVPHGVAADAFYAKGQASVAGLLQILRSVEENEGWRALRVPVPIWVPDILVSREMPASIFIACPECLRAFRHLVTAINSADTEQHCPYCDHQVQVAYVHPTVEIDRTGLVPL